MDKFNSLLQASNFFHSAHGQAVASEIQAGLTAAAVAGVMAENAKAQHDAAKQQGMTTVTVSSPVK